MNVPRLAALAQLRCVTEDRQNFNTVVHSIGDPENAREIFESLAQHYGLNYQQPPQQHGAGRGKSSPSRHRQHRYYQKIQN
jgi:hypothetical protein